MYASLLGLARLASEQF